MQDIATRLLKLDQDETQLRKQILKSSDYWNAGLSRLSKLHEETANELLKISYESGWPSISLAGWEGANAAARLGRHCFTQPVFMKTIQPIIEQAARFGEIGGNWFAEHVDTILFYENKPQAFGTILTWNENLEVTPWTINQPTSVNDRREAFGIEPLDERLEERTERFKDRYDKPLSYNAFRSGLQTWAKAHGWNWAIESKR